jgi:hypothetical protein
LDSNAEDGSSEPHPSASVAEGILRACKDAINVYCNSNRSDDLELSTVVETSLSSTQREELHRYADQKGLFHQSFGPKTDRKLLVRRFAPFNMVGPDACASICGALVAIMTGGVDQSVAHVVRGRVESFDFDSSTWQLAYTDGQSEQVDLQSLNSRLRLRFDSDHDHSTIEELWGKHSRPPQLGGADDATLQKLLDGCDPQWATGPRSRLKYDPKHWMNGWGDMITAAKGSEMARTFVVVTSDAMFKVKPGKDDGTHHEAERHAKAMKPGLADDAMKDYLKSLSRRYWRNRCHYACPEPKRMVRDLYDVYRFFEDLEDPDRPGCKLLSEESWPTFLKQIKYVQQGLLSDHSDVAMYRRIRVCERTGFVFYRCLRTSSPLEGYHLHFRQAVHPCAKTMGPKHHMIRANLFDYVWNVRTAWRAGDLPEVGHTWLWLLDYMKDILKDYPEAELPRYLRDWTRTDTLSDPLTRRGILDDQLVQALEHHNKMSPLRSPADVAKALSEPTAVASGDTRTLKDRTGLETTRGALVAFGERAVQREGSHRVLEANGIGELRSRLKTPHSGDMPGSGVMPREQIIRNEIVHGDDQGDLPMPIASTLMNCTTHIGQVSASAPAPAPAPAPALAPAPAPAPAPPLSPKSQKKLREKERSQARRNKKKSNCNDDPVKLQELREVETVARKRRAKYNETYSNRPKRERSQI